MSKPLVSVIIPVYNRKQFLTEAINSVLNQIYDNIEVIVVDDGSTEDLSEIMNTFKGKIKVKKHNRNLGLSATLNSGLRIARGEFVGILADDDLYTPDKIEKQIGAFKRNPEIDVVYTEYQWLHPDGRINSHNNKKKSSLDLRRNTKNLYYSLLQGNFIDAISPLVRRKCYDIVGGYDEWLKNLEDWDMWLRMTETGFNFYFLDEAHVSVRKHSENKSKNPEKNMHQRLRVLYKTFKNKKFKNLNELMNIRRRSYATVFFDYAFAVYKQENYPAYVKYMHKAIILNSHRISVKVIRRLIKSYIMVLIIRRG
ncbi:MAG: glycosyltransferase [Bacteroidales bacterium]|nr:glycosyltransferase [Bacteroidales bacterium]